MIRRVLFNSFVSYETQKVVQIKSLSIGLMFRITQLFIVVYVIGFVMWYERGYQERDVAISGVSTKVKGVAFANLSHIPSIGQRVWDSSDFVIPPQQNGAFFVMTNMVVTPNQQQTTCPESWEITWKNQHECTTDADCPQGHVSQVGSGVKTGRCVQQHRGKASKRVCEIYGWCPVEVDELPLKNDYLLKQVVNFTVLIKNSIEFPNYHVHRRNIFEGMTKEFVRTCRFNPDDDTQKFCPVFRLGDILQYADAEDKNTTLWTYGGFMAIQIEWQCNLDFAVEYCKPSYSFRRLDDPRAVAGKGWNFRYTHRYYEGNVEKRVLVKAYGVQFFIFVTAEAWKFNMLRFTMNLGAGLGLLGVATVVCDMIAMNITTNKNIFRKAKVDKVEVQAPTAVTVQGEEGWKKLTRRATFSPALFTTTPSPSASLQRPIQIQFSNGQTSSAHHSPAMNSFRNHLNNNGTNGI